MKRMNHCLQQKMKNVSKLNIITEEAPEEDWNSSEIEEGKFPGDKFKKMDQYYMAPLRFSIGKTNETDSRSEGTKGFIKTDLINYTKKCNCKRDLILPCCERASKWIMIMFNDKGRPFSYENYKIHYEVTYFIRLIENIEYRDGR